MPSAVNKLFDSWILHIMRTEINIVMYVSLSRCFEWIIILSKQFTPRFTTLKFGMECTIIFILQGSYPARLKKVLIVTAPLWFKAPFKILRLFVREKLRDRVSISMRKNWRRFQFFCASLMEFKIRLIKLFRWSDYYCPPTECFQ